MVETDYAIAVKSEVDELKDIVTGTHKRYSGFCVILDATRAIPVKNNPNEAHVQLKVIDPSINSKSSEIHHILTIFIYHRLDSVSPFVHKVGDIFRFINFEFSDYKGQLQAKNRPGSYWRIFDGEERAEINDYCKSHEVVEKNDRFLIEKLTRYRKWATSFFQQYSLKELDRYSLERHLENPQHITDFYLVASVSQIKQTLYGLEVTAKDSAGNVYTGEISPAHEGKIKVGSVYMLRGISKVDANNKLLFSQKVAVIEVPDYFYDSREILKKSPIKPLAAEDSRLMNIENPQIETQKQQPPRRVSNAATSSLAAERYEGYNYVQLKKPNPNIKNAPPLVCSIVKNQYKSIKTTEIKEVLEFLRINSIEDAFEKKTKFRICGYVLDIHPKVLTEAVKFFDEKTGSLLNMDDFDEERVEDLKLKPIYLIRILWKDDSISTKDDILVTYIFSYDDNPHQIFPKMDIKGKTKAEILSQQDKFERTVIDEILFNPDRRYEFIAEPFFLQGTTRLDMLDGQIPLRLKDSVFLEVLP